MCFLLGDWGRSPQPPACVWVCLSHSVHHGTGQDHASMEIFLTIHSPCRLPSFTLLERSPNSHPACCQLKVNLLATGQQGRLERLGLVMASTPGWVEGLRAWLAILVKKGQFGQTRAMGSFTSWNVYMSTLFSVILGDWWFSNV